MRNSSLRCEHCVCWILLTAPSIISAIPWRISRKGNSREWDGSLTNSALHYSHSFGVRMGGFFWCWSVCGMVRLDFRILSRHFSFSLKKEKRLLKKKSQFKEEKNLFLKYPPLFECSLFSSDCIISPIRLCQAG